MGILCKSLNILKFVRPYLDKLKIEGSKIGQGRLRTVKEDELLHVLSEVPILELLKR